MLRLASAIHLYGHRLKPLKQARSLAVAEDEAVCKQVIIALKPVAVPRYDIAWALLSHYAPKVRSLESYHGSYYLRHVLHAGVEPPAGRSRIDGTPRINAAR